MSRWYGFVLVSAVSVIALAVAIFLLIHGWLFFGVSVAVLGLLLGWAGIDNRFVYRSRRSEGGPGLEDLNRG